MLPTLPKYTCHKEVRAAKITNFHSPEGMDPKCWLELDVAGERIYHHPEPDWFARHKPEIGGYFVVYNDGYTSFSPAKAFNEGYKPSEPNALELGAMVRAAGLQGE